jgi:hypothetical protein
VKENHKAEEMANGKVEMPNQYGRYFTRSGTLNEKLTLEDSSRW